LNSVRWLSFSSSLSFYSFLPHFGVIKKTIEQENGDFEIKVTNRPRNQEGHNNALGNNRQKDPPKVQFQHQKHGSSHEKRQTNNVANVNSG